MNKFKKAIFVIMTGAIIIASFSACSGKTDDNTETTQAQAAVSQTEAETESAGSVDLSYVDDSGNIVIPTDKITDTALFAGYDADGVSMEIIAVRDSSGEIRLAYNTCQVCTGSPKAYYVQQGTDFICQNCKNAFATDDIGVEHGGCNPLPANATITDDTVTIEKDEITAAASYFKNWKGLNS